MYSEKVLPVIFLVSTLIGTSCSTMTGPDPKAWENLSLQTLQSEFLVVENQSLSIAYKISNEGEKTIYYPDRGSGHVWVLQKLIGDEWIPAFEPILLDILRPPLKLKAGEDIDATISIEPQTWDLALQPRTRIIEPEWRGGDIEGRYRLGIEVFTSWNQKQHEDGGAPTKLVFSNDFLVSRIPE